MKKHSILVLAAMMLFAGKSIGQSIQPCSTDSMLKVYKQQHPEIVALEKQLEEETVNYLKHNTLGGVARRTTAEHHDTDWYDIPVVVHVMHDNGSELLSDSLIYDLIKEMNRFYSLSYDYSSVIPPFQKYVGRAKIRFHLATKDPSGNRTKGITHRATYLTYGGDDYCKMDQWSPTNYINIWFIQRIGAQTTGGIIVAYATPPSSAGAWPYSDGIISNYSFINDAYTTSGAKGGSIDHEMGHILNLKHTFGSTNNPHTNTTGSCSDDDGVDDTPPTEGNLGGCTLYDTICSSNYFKVYVDVRGNDSLVNYPDTSNEQNIMNYADCKVMFTKGQVARMRAALNSNVAGRNNLWDSVNLVNTGALDSTLDLKPIPDFYAADSVAGTNFRMQYFTCPGVKLKFFNRSYRDTVKSLTWTFPATATPNTYTVTAPSYYTSGLRYNSGVYVAFQDAGWAAITLKATGNNTGDSSVTWDNAVFVADKTPTDGNLIVEDFDPARDLAKWPTFNYYNNEFKWEASSTTGFYDHYCMKYKGFDSRVIPGSYPPITGHPGGDFDDMFSIPVDLSKMTTTACYLDFYSSGASRSSNSLDINDSLTISYSVDSGKKWSVLHTLSKSELCNKGSFATDYTPSSISDWAAHSINIPVAARKSYVVFRFRYNPGITAGNSKVSSGNNFYMDRITFSPYTAEVSSVRTKDLDVVVAPNPTSGNAIVIVKDADNATANITVSDITGKVVYATSHQISGNEARIEIPATAIAVKGIYLVQTTTGRQTSTQKLVVY